MKIVCLLLNKYTKELPLLCLLYGCSIWHRVGLELFGWSVRERDGWQLEERAAIRNVVCT